MLVKVTVLQGKGNTIHLIFLFVQYLLHFSLANKKVFFAVKLCTNTREELYRIWFTNFKNLEPPELNDPIKLLSSRKQLIPLLRIFFPSTKKLYYYKPIEVTTVETPLKNHPSRFCQEIGCNEIRAFAPQDRIH